MKPLLGAHVPVSGGFHKGIEHGEAIGAECIQFFGASPRSYSAPLPSAETVQNFKERLNKSSIKSFYLHGAYLVNLGSADPSILNRSVANLTAHYAIANMLGAGGLIFHVGSPNAGDRKEALIRAVGAMKEVLTRVPGESYLVMENSGSVKKIGGTLDDLHFLFQQVADPRLKICIDTAHALEAGLIESYTRLNIKKFFDQLDDAFGARAVVAMHANDSKTPYNSQNDKHENIGRGYIGREGFENLSKEKRIVHMNFFMEVPGIDGTGSDKPNMDALKRCFDR